MSEHGQNIAWSRCAGSSCPYTSEGETCPNCGYYRTPVPEWLKKAYFSNEEIVFGFQGKRYRVVSIGSTNDIHGGHHYRDYAAVVEHGAVKPALPALPATKSAVYTALQSIFACEKIYAADLASVIRSVP